MNDLISREAALNCFHDWVDKHGDVHTPDEMAEYRELEALPSVQPVDKDIHVPCTDAIDRQAAIDAIKELCLHYTPTKSVDYPRVDFVIEELEGLPSVQPYTEDEIQKIQDLEQSQFDAVYKLGEQSAQPERIRGHWIGGNGSYICSECNGNPIDFINTMGASFDAYVETPMDFCPFCGADMRGETDNGAH